MTSITPFGQTGPYEDFKATDIVIMALGGMVFVTGDPDRPPVRLSYPIAYLLASADAAVATLIAHYYRELTGNGQYIDVSAQQAVTWLTINIRGWWELEKKIVPRSGQLRERRAGGFQHLIWPCKDGAVIFMLLGGAMGPRSNRALAQWIKEEGMGDEFLESFDWESFDWSQASSELFSRLEEPIARFFLTKTRAELYEEAIKRRVILTPVSTIKDVAQSPQLSSREFWVKLEHPELNTDLTYPGAFIKAPLSPWPPKHRAPLIGEHNEEVYKEIGISQEELLILKQAGVI
jgi:crotonobetainyl-CoA:carnitine CoA-transferase CaiB-like acyl-CoA transferase